MANSTVIQVRAAEEDKKRASEILEQLGTNLSAVVNMLLKQIILTESIPFEIKLNTEKSISSTNALEETAATMRIEDMDLDQHDCELLSLYADNKERREEIRENLIGELKHGKL